MNRSFASRVSALLLALTFLSGQAGREASHACPIHDAIGIQHPQALQLAQAEHHHGNAVSTAPASEGHDHGGADCTCIGNCNVSSPGVTTPSANTLAFTEYFSNVASAFGTAHIVLPGRPDFQLPLSSGPPDALRIA